MLITIDKTKKHILKIFRKFQKIWYIGNNVECPICGSHFRKFAPYKNRRNVSCLKCDSFERHRLLWMFLNNKTDMFSGKHLKILHFAPESCYQDIFRSMQHVNYVSSDLCSPLVEIRMDITNISFKENSFDVILCIHVLEHIIKDQIAMRELFRILKPGGWAILQSPVDLERDKTLEEPNMKLPENHVRIYGRDYKERLENAGFTVKVYRYINELEEYIKKYGLLKEEIYFCTK